MPKATNPRSRDMTIPHRERRRKARRARIERLAAALRAEGCLVTIVDPREDAHAT